MPHGKLTVIVESATNIRGKRGSYCTLQCGSQVLSTEVAEGGGSDPVFHTEFEFEIDSSTNELAISVYSIRGTVKDDKLVGYVFLNFKQVFYHGHTVPLTAYPLSRSSGKAGGFINISLNFKSNSRVPVRQYSAPPQAAPQHSQTIRNQQNPLRQTYPNGTEACEDGYGSSGSESSMSSRGSSKESRESVGYKRSQSEPLPRPFPLAPAGPPLGPRRPVNQGGPHVAILSQPRELIPRKPQLNFANPYPPQQPPRMVNPQVQVHQNRSLPPARLQNPAHVHHHHQGLGAQIAGQMAKAAATEAAKCVVDGLFKELFQ